MLRPYEHGWAAAFMRQIGAVAGGGACKRALTIVRASRHRD
jgi:hypothetical protein